MPSKKQSASRKSPERRSNYQIVIDTREQLPLEFAPEVDTVVETMSFGDYTMRHYDCSEAVPIVFERKSLPDLYGTMTNGYKRFKAEYHRCQAKNAKMVLLIEATMRDVACGYEYCDFPGESMIKKLAMLEVRYGIQVVYGQDRSTCARYIQEIFNAVDRNWKKENKNGKVKPVR